MLVDPLGLYHQQCMIKQEDQKIRILAIGATSSLERSLVDELSTLVSEMQVL